MGPFAFQPRNLRKWRPISVDVTRRELFALRRGAGPRSPALRVGAVRRRRRKAS